MEDDYDLEDEVQDADFTRRKTLIIKYSDFLAAAIDERKIFTREKVHPSSQYDIAMVSLQVL